MNAISTRSTVSASRDIVPGDLQSRLAHAIYHIGRSLCPVSQLSEDGRHGTGHYIDACVGAVVLNDGTCLPAFTDISVSRHVPGFDGNPGTRSVTHSGWVIRGWDFNRPLTDIDWEATILFYEMQTAHQP